MRECTNARIVTKQCEILSDLILGMAVAISLRVSSTIEEKNGCRVSEETQRTGLLKTEPNTSEKACYDSNNFYLKLSNWHVGWVLTIRLFVRLPVVCHSCIFNFSNSHLRHCGDPQRVFVYAGVAWFTTGTTTFCVFNAIRQVVGAHFVLDVVLDADKNPYFY